MLILENVYYIFLYFDSESQFYIGLYTDTSITEYKLRRLLILIYETYDT